MVVHLWGKFWMAAWHGGRARVWMTGAITFLIAVPAALTGYVSQQNFDSQWISTQAKDAMNAIGAGAFFNVTNFGQMYNYTKPLLFMADGKLLEQRAEAGHLLGKQWGMMNETGSYPGQSWLWLYTLWYQIKPFSTSGNADILVVMVMAVLSLAFILVPFLPIIRSIPRWVPLHRLIWREHYRRHAVAGRDRLIRHEHYRAGTP
jgi:hypothetical protein